MHGENGSDKERYRAYHDKVFLPFINVSRTKCNDWPEGEAIVSDLREISWCNETLVQIDNIVSLELLDIYETNMITENKQNPQCAGLEQAVDLTLTFSIMQYLQQTYICKDIPIQYHSMKHEIVKVFAEEKKAERLMLKVTQENSLTDFIVSIQAMSSKATIYKGATHSFLKSGYIYKKHIRYPNCGKLLTTCRTDPTKKRMPSL